MNTRVDVLINGYPGWSPSNGGLSWSTVGLVRNGDRVVVIDTGAMGARALLQKRLAAHRLEFSDVTDLVITHLHHDHSINWPLFSAARIHLSRREIEWALDLPPSIEPAPEFYAAALAQRPGTVLLDDSDEVLPGIETVAAPGHTPGSILVSVAGTDGTVIFTGDAAKNRAELVSTRAAATSDPESSRRSLEAIMHRWHTDERTVVVPGHDLPLRWRGERCETIGARVNSLQARLGDDFDDVTEIPLR